MTQVTNDTKVIQGVRATVVHDVLFVNGIRAEDTFDWYAQDAQLSSHRNKCVANPLEPTVCRSVSRSADLAERFAKTVAEDERTIQ